MEGLLIMKEGTGFPANINNFISTGDDYKYVENSSDKFSSLEIIKNEFFIVEDQPSPLELSTQSFFKPLS